MPPKKDKEAKKEKSNQQGSKGKKKKWSKGKTREALENAVMFDQTTFEKLKNEVPKYKLITPSVVSDRLKVTVSAAAQGLKYLAKKKLIKSVLSSRKLCIYTRNIQKEEEVAAPAAAAAAVKADAPAKAAKAPKAPKAAAPAK